MIKVSIIIPVYNTEKYLRRCLNSIINQTLEEIEIICVNDGSTDGSMQILQEYADQDNRITIVYKENGGLVSARKAGLSIAIGKYVGYVDSDDWIEPDMYENLYDAAQKHHADMVASGYYLEGNYVTLHLDTVEQGLYVGEEKIQYLRENTIYQLNKKAPGIRGSLCCKLFSLELLKKIQLSISDKLSFAEDKMCVLAFMLEAETVVVLKEAYYHYMINADSMVHTPNTNYLLCVNEVYHCLLNLYKHPKFTANMRKQAELYITEMLVMGINSRLGFENRNLLWIDPYWLEKIPANSRVVLYGAGELGRKYHKQLMASTELEYVACVDHGYQKIQDDVLQVQSPEALLSLTYDYVLITIKNPSKATSVRIELESLGVPKDKILWYEQKEIYWKYAEADGLLDTNKE